MTLFTPEPLDRGELQRRAVKGALWTGIHTFVSLPIAFVVNILVARVLGVADYGRLTYLTTVITIASVVAGLGVTTALIQFGSKAHAEGRTGEVRALLSAAQGFRLTVVGPVVALVVFLLVQVEWRLLGVALVFGVGMPALLGNARPALTIENRTDRAAQLTMIGNLVLQVAVVLSVLTVGTPDAVWSARVIASGVLLILPLLIISPPYRRAVLSPAPPWRLPRPFWAFALPTGAAGIVGALVSNRTEVVLLDWFADPHAMGLFGLAFGLAGHVYAPAQAFVGPLVPAVSALASVDEASVRRAFLRTTRVGSTVGGLLVVAALPALACLVPVIYGREYSAAGDLLVVIGLGSAVMLVGSPHQAFLMARLGGGRLLGVNLVSLGVNLVLALALIPVVGAWGAAVACAGALLAQSVLLTMGEAKALDLPAHQVVRSSSSLPIAMAVAVVLWVSSRPLEVSELVLAPALATVGLSLYLLALRVCGSGMTEGDGEAVLASLPRQLHRVGGPVLALVRRQRG